MFGMRPNGGGRLDPDFSQIDTTGIGQFVNQYGVSIRYWKAIECPCAKEQSGQPNLACANCRGVGFFYLEPEREEKYLRALVHSRSSNKRQDPGGRVTQGRVSITFLQGVIPGDGDLIQPCHDTEVVNNEFHVVGSTLTDGTSAERLRFRDVQCVEKVMIWDAVTKKVTVAENCVDWTFDQATRIVTLKRPVGAQYSVRYQARPEYIVKGETAKPLLRTSHDGGQYMNDENRVDQVLPFNVEAVRLDREIAARLRGNVDFTTPSTFNDGKPIGTPERPFR